MRQPKALPAGHAEAAQGKQQPVTDRRTLLIGLPALGAGAGLAISAGTEETSGGLDTGSDPRQLRYRETQHIRTYYALARR